MKKILIDTNFLLIPHEYKIDVISELCRIIHTSIHIFIASGTINELHTLSSKKGRRAMAARFGLLVLERIKEKFKTKIIESSGEVDQWIIKFVQKKPNVSVATNDIVLRKKLLASGTSIITLKGKSKLDFA